MDGLACHGIVRCHLVGIRSVLEELHLVCAGGQETEVELQAPALPVGLAGQVPVVALAACHDDVLAHLSLEAAHLVEDGGQGGDEVGAFLLLAVDGGIVGQHGEG